MHFKGILLIVALMSSSLLFFVLSLSTAYSANETIALEKDASCISSSCHNDMGKKKYVHAVGVNGMFCTRCHQTSDETVHSFKDIPEETRSLCSQCHSEEFPGPTDLEKMPPKVISVDEAMKLHGPFKDGKCTACHDAHESDYYRHLKHEYPDGLYATFSMSRYALCLNCHENLSKVLTEPRTLELTKFRNGNLNLHYRHVNKNKGRTCSICHHPHGLKDPKLIKSNFKFGNRLLTVNYEKTETGGKCETTCHRVAKYDRYKPEFNLILVSPRMGDDATEEELKESYEQYLNQKNGKVDEQQKQSE